MAFIDAENDQAPSNKPLNELEIEVIKDEGVTYIKALDPVWCTDKTYLSYAHPPHQSEDGTFPIGAKEDWLETMDLYLEDLKWLLRLPQHKFWSNMVFKPECMEMMLSFLQDAPPFYILEEFPNDQDMLFVFQQVYHHVFLVVKRLATSRESEGEYMSLHTLGELIYDNYIFTVPMMMDLCLMYGRTRRSQVHNIISTVFSAQPNYEEDVKKSVGSITKSLSYVEKKFAARTVTVEPVKLSSKSLRGEVTIQELKDMVLHVLDISATLNLFLDICSPARKIFHQQMFCLRIVNFYENTIPEMYAKLELLMNRETMELLHADTKHKLDIARVELLAAFRHILSYPLHCAIDNMSNRSNASLKMHVDDYCSILQECLSEKVFMRDYHSAHPIDVDLQLLSSVSSDIEDKKHYLMEAVLLSFDPPELKPRPPPVTIRNGMLPGSLQESSSSTGKQPVTKVTGVQLESLIAEVKDILSHLGDGFVEHCLEHYNYSSESVINAVLENSLPPTLSSLDFCMPRRIPKVEDVNGLSDRINVFDNDEFDIMTRDDVDTSRIHQGKRKSKHKDLNQMLNDKSAVSEIREKYVPLGYVDMDEKLYDDEYDDTYDHLDVSIDEPGGEPDRRPIVVPRVLRSKDGGNQDDSSEDDDEPPGDGVAKPRDEFIENPEVVRARAEQRRQMKFSRGRGRNQGSAPPRDVVGGPKGQGQDKDVLRSRQKKAVNKSSVSNHNRKSGAQWKRSKCMVPS